MANNRTYSYYFLIKLFLKEFSSPGRELTVYIVCVWELTFSENMEFPDVVEKLVLNRSVLGNASPELLEFFMCPIAINLPLMGKETFYYSNKSFIYRTTPILFFSFVKYPHQHKFSLILPIAGQCI